MDCSMTCSYCSRSPSDTLCNTAVQIAMEKERENAHSKVSNQEYKIICYII